MEINNYLATETFLQEEFIWLENIIKIRIETYFNTNENETSIYDIKPPIIGIESPYESFLLHYELDFIERIIIAMISASTLKPEVFDLFHTKNEITGIIFPEFGGKIEGRRFLPTFRTAAFLLNESDTVLPLALFSLFDKSHPFTAYSLLDFTQTSFQTRIDSVMRFSIETEHLLYSGELYLPEFNSEFPVKELKTNLEWEDLVLSKNIKNSLDEIHLWFKLENELSQNRQLSKWLKPGYCALFYGPPGTGKTLTATLLGKQVKRPVYRVDLSMGIAKYIGETEKNLAKIFDRAENNNWVLFFDEADAIFGKRTEVSASNRRHSNQVVAYLLQRIEDFSGLIILSTNLQNNLDDTFSRRFQIEVAFQQPNKGERFKLWKLIFSGEYSIDENFLEKVAEEYELTGGAIINVLRTAVLHSVKESPTKISKESILYAIRKELL